MIFLISIEEMEDIEMNNQKNEFQLGGGYGYQQNGYQFNNMGFQPEKRTSNG